MDPWGEGFRHTTLGLVVDLCANCAALQSHWICEEHNTVQVAFLNVDRGLYERTLVVCCRCSVWTEIEPSRYAQVLASGDASTVTLSEGLSRTNPALKKALDVLEAARAAQAPFRMLDKAEAVLFAKRDLDDVVADLARWATLSSEQRTNAIARVHGNWQVAGGPERPRTAAQPGDRTFFTPTRTFSILRSFDRKAVFIVLLIAALMALLVTGTPIFRRDGTVSAEGGSTSSASSPDQPLDELSWFDLGASAFSVASFLAFLIWRRVQRRTIDDLRKKAGIDS
jgi:hypothetical protein